MESSEKIQENNDKQIDLNAFTEEFLLRAPILYKKYQEEKKLQEQDASDSIIEALLEANTNLQYLIQNIAGFSKFLDEMTALHKSYFGRDAKEAITNSQGNFCCLRQFGFMNIAGTTSLGLHNKRIILTSSHLSDDLRIAYDSRLDTSHFKYLNIDAILEELKYYNTPTKLLEILLLKKYKTDGLFSH